MRLINSGYQFDLLCESSFCSEYFEALSNQSFLNLLFEMDELNNFNKEGIELSDEENYMSEAPDSKKVKTLNEYITLLEKRVLSLVPDHPLPVMESHFNMKLGTTSFTSSQTDTNLFNFQRKNADLSEKLKQRETEVQKLIRDNDQLKSMLNQSTNMSTQGSLNKPKLIQKDKIKQDFPAVERLTKDLQSDLAVMYKELIKSHAYIQQEKEKVLKALREETIQNEEQRNYIEILRQTIESQILKQGLSAVLNLQKTYYKGTNASSVDMMVDISKLISEAEKYRKELVKSEVLITEVKQENQFLQKSSEDLDMKISRLKEIIDNQTFELEEEKGQKLVATNEVKELNKIIEDFKANNSKLNRELETKILTIRGLEKDIYELQKRLISSNSQLENQKKLEEKTSNFQAKSDNLSQELNQYKKEKISSEAKVMQLKEEIDDLKKDNEESSKMIDSLKAENDKMLALKNAESENLNRQLRKIEQALLDEETLLKDRDRELKKLNDSLIISERSVNTLKNQNEYLEKDLRKKEEEKEKELMKLESIVKESQTSLVDCTRENDKVYLVNEKLKNELKNKENEVKDLREEVRKLNRQINQLSDNINNLNRMIKGVESENQGLAVDFDKIQKELKYWREKYDKEITAKIEEITSANDQNSILKREITGLNCELTEITSKYKAEHDERNELEGQLAYREGQVKNLENYEKDSIKLRDQIKIIERELEYAKKEKEECLRLINDMKHQIDILIKEKSMVEEGMRKQKNAFECTQSDLQEKRRDHKKAEESVIHLNHELNKTSDQNSELKNMISSLEKENEDLHLNLKDRKKENSYLTSANMNLEKTNSKFSSEIENLNSELKESNAKLSNLTSFTNEIGMSFKSLSTAMNLIVTRLERSNAPIPKSENLISFIAFANSISPIDNNNMIDQICFAEDLLKSLLDELEYSFTSIKDLKYDLNLKNDRILQSEDKIGNLEKMIGSLNTHERDMSSRIIKTEENSKMIKASKESAEDKLRILMHENRDLKQNLQKVREFCQGIERENGRKDSAISGLNSELYKVSEEIEKITTANSSLENRIVILLKEKKLYVGLISLLSKCSSNTSVQIVINNIMNVYDNLIDLEKEKLKLDMRLVFNERELNTIKNSGEGKISIRTTLLNERDQLENYLKENKRQILERYEQLQQLETGIKEAGSLEKRKVDSAVDIEAKMKRLAKESQDMRRSKTDFC